MPAPTPKTTPDTLILLSGGMDSTLCAVLANEQGRLRRTLFIDYHQPAARQERAVAGALAHRLDVPHLTMERALVDEEVIGEMTLGVGAPGPRVVPARNLWLISLATAAALRTGCTYVWIGCNMTDAKNYPDCRVAFIQSINTLTTNAYGIKVEAPLLHHSKRAIHRRLLDFGIDPTTTTWSCYEPTAAGRPCGSCNACLSVDNADERDE